MTKIKPVGCRILFQSIVNAKKLDVLHEDQLRLFLNMWMEFELTQAIIHFQDITSLKIDGVENLKNKCCHIVYFSYTAIKIDNPLNGKFVLPYSAA